MQYVGATCDKSKFDFSAIFCNANERKHEYIQGFDTSGAPVIHHACFPGGFLVGAPSNGDVGMFSSITGGGGVIIKRLRVLARDRKGHANRWERTKRWRANPLISACSPVASLLAGGALEDLDTVQKCLQVDERQEYTTNAAKCC